MAASVIVPGGGFAGLDELTGRRGQGVCVTLIDRRPHATFSPLLPDAVSQRVLPQRMLYPLAAHCRRRGAEFVQAEALAMRRRVLEAAERAEARLRGRRRGRRRGPRRRRRSAW